MWAAWPSCCMVLEIRTQALPGQHFTLWAISPTLPLLSHFPCCYDYIPGKKKLKGARVYFASQINIVHYRMAWQQNV